MGRPINFGFLMPGAGSDGTLTADIERRIRFNTVRDGIDLHQPRIGRSIRKWMEIEATIQIAMTNGHELRP